MPTLKFNMTDSTTAVACIRNVGGSHSFLCNDKAKHIWNWCILRQIWLAIGHIPGELNEIADSASRMFDDSTEWKLNADDDGNPRIDMFAPRLNYQLPAFVSWMPDSHAVTIDALSMDCRSDFFYIFFSPI